VGLDGGEGVVADGGAGLGEGVEEGGLAGIRQADDADAEAHAGGSWKAPSTARSRACSFTRVRISRAPHPAHDRRMSRPTCVTTKRSLPQGWARLSWTASPTEGVLKARRAGTRGAAPAPPCARRREMMQVMRISLVEISSMLIPASARVRNIVAAMPGVLSIPVPTTDTLAMSAVAS